MRHDIVLFLNCFSLDRPDLQFAARQASRYMATPQVSDWALLKRTARYLVWCPRSVQTFRWQVRPSMVTTFIDSDWAGDRGSRKSTSGGVVCLGHHVIKSWSSTTTRGALKWRSGMARYQSDKRHHFDAYGFRSDIRWYSLHRCISCNENLISKGFRPHSPFWTSNTFGFSRGTSESRQSCNQRVSGRYLDKDCGE